MPELRGQVSLEDLLDEPIEPGLPAGSRHIAAHQEFMAALELREHVDSDTPNMLDL